MYFERNWTVLTNGAWKEFQKRKEQPYKSLVYPLLNVEREVCCMQLYTELMQGFKMAQEIERIARQNLQKKLQANQNS